MTDDKSIETLLSKSITSVIGFSEVMYRTAQREVRKFEFLRHAEDTRGAAVSHNLVDSYNNFLSFLFLSKLNFGEMEFTREVSDFKMRERM